KHYLVPVVERVPFVPVRLFRSVPGLGNWSGGFSPGSTLPLYPSSLGRFGVVICYESAFEDLARRYRAAGADFLVNITNDAWYGRTAGPYQHATHLVMRAIETRTGIARAANDGISEFVDPLGRTYSATGLEVEAVMRVGVDVGGTFTDLVALTPEGAIAVRKVATTPDDPAVGMFRALDALASPAIELLVHGTTIATNALLERRGARVVLVTTRGF